jgi:hypothetical protein
VWACSIATPVQPEATSRDGTKLVGASGSASLPSWNLIAISHEDAAESNTSVLMSPTASRTRPGNRAGLASIQSHVWVSTSTLT